jgi:hypothetical protein
MNYRRGFVALMSVLIISALLLSATLASGTALYFARKDMLGEILYRQSRATVYSCATLALHAISIDRYRFENTVPTRFTIDERSTCVIDSVEVHDTTARIVVQGISGSSFSTVTVLGTRIDSLDSFTIDRFEKY